MDAQEIRIKCLEFAVAISIRNGDRAVKNVVDIATELEQYINTDRKTVGVAGVVEVETLPAPINPNPKQRLQRTTKTDLFS